MTQYSNSFLVRDNLDDFGNNDNTPWWISPDIICYGQNTLTPATAASTYKEYIDQPFVNGQPNNFYIRAGNIGSKRAKGAASLFVAPASLFLMPATWKQISTAPVPFVNTAKSTHISLGEVCVTNSPIQWRGVPDGGHYCMIATANTNGVPFPVPTSFSSNAEYIAWVQGNANVAQRNMSLIPVQINEVNFTVTLGNTNPGNTNFLISITQGTTGTAFPSSTSIDLAITDQRLNPNPYAPNNQSWNPGSGVVFTGLTMPGNINGTPANPLMTMTISIILPNSTSFEGTAPVIINYYQIPSGSAEETSFDVVRTHKVPSVANPGTMENQQLILLGSCTFDIS